MGVFSPRRDASIDAVRGLCVLSMVAAHLSKRSVLDDVTHPIPWIDGASGFILLSGLLVGMIQRSTMDRLGEPAGLVKLLRRVRLVYLCHLLIVAIALAFGTSDPGARADLPSIQAHGGLGPTIWAALTLQINPAYASVLSVYVVLMLASTGLLVLLRRRKWIAAVGYSGGIYLIGLLRPEWSTPPQMGRGEDGWAYAAWFGLFAAGIWAGWFWRTAGVRRFTGSAFTLAAAIFLLVLVLVAARLTEIVAFGGRLLEKDAFGPGRLLLAVAFFFVLWCVAGLAVDRWPAVMRPLTIVGTRSLDSYILLSVAVIAIPSLSVHEQDSGTGVLIAVAVLALCLVWAVVRSRWRSGPPPDDAALSPAAGSGPAG